MASPEIERDEPLTPTGRLFLRPEMNQIIHGVVGGKHPIDIDEVKTEIRNSLMVKHPRFSSLLVRDGDGREYWRKTRVDLERHLIIRHEPVGAGDDESAVNDYVADLTVSTPLPTDKPLWEIHLLMAHKCAVFRIHHALGDGMSLMSLFLSCCRKADDPERSPKLMPAGASTGRPSSGRTHGRVWRMVRTAWFTVVFMAEFVLRILWLRDRRTAVSGGAGVELWPRKLATATFLLDDMKTVKKAVGNATINDVLFGVISCGLSRYLDIRSPKALREGLQITGIAMVNLRKHHELQEISDMEKSNWRSWWGNKLGIILLPVYYHRTSSDPLEYVKRAKKMIDRKKQSLEAYFSYKIGDIVMSCFGPRAVSWLNYRVICNTTFTISNVVGPKEEITLVGNPVAYLRVNNTSLPHAITMHMLSYAGKAYLQILVAKEIIPDPQVLARCFEDALLEMKEAAILSDKAYTRH